MLALFLDDLSFELDEGSIKHVGPPSTAASVKLFDVADAGARAFGDKRVKLVFEDDGGNEVQVALFPADARAVAEDIERLAADHPAFD